VLIVKLRLDPAALHAFGLNQRGDKFGFLSIRD